MIIIVTKKLTPEAITRIAAELEQWFKNNPKRNICRTDVGKVRKTHIKEDLSGEMIQTVSR